MGLRRTDPPPLHPVVPRRWGRDRDGLLAQLHEGLGHERRWAARDLAGHPDTAAQLGAHLGDEQDPSVREALFTSLSTHANEAAASALIPLLRSEDASLRNGAIEALAGMPAAVAPRMAALLHDRDPEVRIFTVNLLGDLRHPRVADWLVDVLVHDNEVNVVAAAIEVLAEVGGPQHRPALAAVVRRFPDDPFIGFAADMAAGRAEAA